MHTSPTSRRLLARGAVAGFSALLLLATAGFRCPGPEGRPAPDEEGSGGAAASSGIGSTVATSTVATSTGDGASSSTDATSSSGEGGTGGGSGGAGGDGGCGGADLETDVDNCGACGRRCVDDALVDEPICIAGVCRSTCADGRANITFPPGDAQDDGCETEGRRVFISSTAVSSNVGGVTDADDVCSDLAASADLGGEWLAWITDGIADVDGNTNAPVHRFTRSAEGYVLLSGEVVAADYDALTNTIMGNGFELEHAINVNELGLDEPATDLFVWTGVNSGGFGTISTPDCLEWTSVDPDEFGSVGDANAVDTTWTQVLPVLACGAPDIRIYCFEQ